MHITIAPSRITTLRDNIRKKAKEMGFDIKESSMHEIIAKSFGFKDWNTLAAKMKER